MSTRCPRCGKFCTTAFFINEGGDEMLSLHCAVCGYRGSWAL